MDYESNIGAISQLVHDEISRAVKHSDTFRLDDLSEDLSKYLEEVQQRRREVDASITAHVAMMSAVTSRKSNREQLRRLYCEIVHVREHAGNMGLNDYVAKLFSTP